MLSAGTLALYDMAHLLKNDPAYLSRTFPNISPISDFREAVKQSQTALAKILQTGCGNTVKVCSKRYGALQQCGCGRYFLCSDVNYKSTRCLSEDRQ